MHADAIGTKAVGGDAMRRNTIFRVSSLTKPIAAAAAMILVDERRLRLDEPVDRLLPELADRHVLKRLDGPLDDTVPAKRPISVLDLLTLRMGFGFIMGPPDAYPILAAVDEQKLGMGPPKPATPHEPDEWIRRFATLPLMHQPGEQWMYEMGFAAESESRRGGQDAPEQKQGFHKNACHRNAVQSAVSEAGNHARHHEQPPSVNMPQ